MIIIILIELIDSAFDFSGQQIKRSKEKTESRLKLNGHHSRAVLCTFYHNTQYP